MNEKNHLFGHLFAVMSWMFTAVSPNMIPIILSCVTSVMGAVNYYYSIKKNKQK